MSDIDILSDGNNLLKAFNKTKKPSLWKRSVKEYRINLLSNLAKTQQELQFGEYKQRPYNEFSLSDRGKTRWIKACHIFDRVVLSSLCENILIPRMNKYLIYDNGASVKNKGISFTRKRLEMHLHKYFREHGSNQGYILLVDFSKYFDNIVHEILFRLVYNRESLDDKVTKLLEEIVDGFKVDVSFLGEEDFDEVSFMYNSLECPKCTEGKRFLHKSLGIGSPISQVFGIFHPTPMDNLCKIVLRLAFMARYMDDSYVIHESKEYLTHVLSLLLEICDALGIFVNTKKTRIIRLDKWFVFLKIHYRLTSTGRVIRRLEKESFRREKRRLRALVERVNDRDDDFSTQDAVNGYKSWRNNTKGYHNHFQRRKMDKRVSRLLEVNIKCLE